MIMCNNKQQCLQLVVKDYGRNGGCKTFEKALMFYKKSQMQLHSANMHDIIAAISLKYVIIIIIALDHIRM